MVMLVTTILAMSVAMQRLVATQARLLETQALLRYQT